MTSEPFDYSAVLDAASLGNDPTENYLQRVDMLDNVVRECMHVSKSYAGIPAPTSQHFYASVLFTTLITRGLSLAILAPFSPWSSKLIEHWDYASASVIVRTMLEIRLCFFYICVDPCPRIEWECRWNILNLHDCNARIRLFEGRPGGQTEVDGFRIQAEELRDRLRSNAHFQSLPLGQQKKYLNGQTPFMFALEEIGVKAGIEASEFRWLYVFLSSHVHGFPMSFYRMGTPEGDGRGRGLPTPVEENYTCLCLSLAASLLVRTRDEVHALFKDCVRVPEAVDDAKVESDIESVERLPVAMEVGASVDLVKTDRIRIEAKRVSDNAFDVSYFHEPTGEEVLRRSISESSGSALHSFDSAYWTVLVNGDVATRRMVEGIERKRIAFKIEVDARTLHIKMEGDDRSNSC